MPYEYLQQLWRKHDPELLGWLREEAVEWRRDPVIMRIHRPTRPDKARMLGYKAKQGIIMVRVRVRTGGENRVLRKYPNMTLANSYHLYSDGKNHWYEVILVDQSHPANQD
jgi:large subunit ribosomal protein L15e